MNLLFAFVTHSLKGTQITVVFLFFYLSPNSTIIRHRIRDLLRSQQMKMSKQGNSSDKKRESLSGSYSGVNPNFSDSFEAKTASCLLLLLDFDTI